MIKRIFAIILFLNIFCYGQSQTMENIAEKIRVEYKIPELAFAVVSSDKLFESKVLGIQRVNTNFLAKTDDRFHLGSNTKAIAAFISAILVNQGKINWNTKFLDLFPELLPTSRKVYRDITLEDLLTFRGKLPAYTYTFEKPDAKEIVGSNYQQRFLLAKYFLSQKPMKSQNGLTPSNADYILAGLMIEKATGKTFKELVSEFGQTQQINFGFDYPNLNDILQPWGHDDKLNALPPSDNLKLNWLLSAGNINVNLADYGKFIQLQLKGLKGQSNIFSADIFEKLLYGKSNFSFGWFNKVDDETKHRIAYNEGNAGAFITEVKIIKEADRAYIIFTNSATPETIEGVKLLMTNLESKYGK